MRHTTTCILAPWLLVLSTAAGVLAGCSRRGRDEAPADEPIAEPIPIEPRNKPQAPPGETRSSPFRDAPLHVADPTNVDPVELLPQARKIALGYDAHAVLTSIHAHKGVTAGTVDVTGDDGVTFDFEWLYFDKSRPPGSDKVENGLWISARRGQFTITELNHAMSFMGSRRVDPGPDPHCSARAAWKAAVQSGMPSNAVATMRYAPEFPPGPGQPYLWDFRVEGHDELEREVSGATCAIAGRPRGRR